MNTTEPERGMVPQCTSSRVLPRPGPAGRMDPAMQMSLRLRTAWVDLALDGDVLYGRPRSAAGYVGRLDGPALADWGQTSLPAWQNLDAAGWAETARLLTEWVRARDAAAVAAVPEGARRAAELSASKIRDTRRAALERQAAEAAAALAEFAAAPEPAEAGVEPTRRGGWMRRAPMPP